MKSFFDKLNLRPQERRMVVIVGIVLFIVVNVIFVRPIFGEYSRIMTDMAKAQTSLNRYQLEIKKKPQYEQQLRKLESSGSFVAQEEQASQLMKDVTSQAALSGVAVMDYIPGARGSSGKTNAFFEEQSLGIRVNTGEKELIDFLYNLGSGSSLIRVRTMTLNPEPSHFKLQGNLTLVESFQKKPPAKSAAASSPATKAAPANQGSKPPAETNPAKKSVPLKK
jgi:hypothetical protein